MYRRPDLYDAIYSSKDYAAEAARVRDLALEYGKKDAATLLDIACGTGKHVEHFRQWFECEGLDLSPQLLKAARERNPGVTFYEGDMQYFNLGRWFDVVVCLFSAIGYVKTFEGLERALAAFGHHVAPGGVLIVEPWIRPDAFTEGHLGMNTVDEPETKIARMNYTRREGDLSILEFQFLIGTRDGIETLHSRSELGLFTRDEYMVACERAGLDPHWDEHGLTGRGLLICQKS